MKIGLFGGSFDPVHRGHVAAAKAAKSFLGLDRLIVIPSRIAPHKRGGATADGALRAELLKIAFRGIAEVSTFELDAAGTSYSYLTCRHFREKYPDATLFFLVGADMLRDFFTWKEPRAILGCVTLAAFGRAGDNPELHDAFRAAFGVDYIDVPFMGDASSSTQARVDLAFGKDGGLDEEVLKRVRASGCYTDPVIQAALALETEERREHSYRVARLAVARAKSAGIPERTALLAAAIHDCGKSVPLDSPLLAGFSVPADVPAPVLHQYTGAYIAQTLGVDDEEVLDAVRYHASGREDMTPLGKLVYAADLLEEGRKFAGVEELRALFWEDLDRCMEAALLHQIEYLRSAGKPVYALTYRAYEWLKSKK